jgi:hypothetical protein
VYRYFAVMTPDKNIPGIHKLLHKIMASSLTKDQMLILAMWHEKSAANQQSRIKRREVLRALMPEDDLERLSMRVTPRHDGRIDVIVVSECGTILCEVLVHSDGKLYYWF